MEIINVDTLIARPDIADTVANSIAILVSKSNKNQMQALGKINKLITELEKKGDQMDKRDKITVKILRSVHQNKRVALFKEPQEDGVIEPSGIMETLSEPDKHWEFYTAQDYMPNTQVFQLPIHKHFETLCKLKPDQRDAYHAHLKAKKDLMRRSYELLNKFVNKTIANWHDGEPIDYSEEFEEMRELVAGHPYGSYEGMLEDMGYEEDLSEGEDRHTLGLDLLKVVEDIYK